LAKVKGLLTAPYFFDLRNIYKADKVLSAGFKYYGIGC